MYRNQKIAIVIIVVLVLTLGVIVPSFVPIKENQSSEKPKFIIASWEYPDEYAQGIYSMTIKQNISGSFVELDDSPVYHTDKGSFEIEPNGNLFIQVIVYFNRSQAGIDNVYAQGLNVIRLNVTVIDNLGSIVFSQQNFTDDAHSQAGDPIWWIRYYAYLDFAPLRGEIYTATITYEVYY